jgi:hypothetical protein
MPAMYVAQQAQLARLQMSLGLKVIKDSRVQQVPQVQQDQLVRIQRFQVLLGPLEQLGLRGQKVIKAILATLDQ